MAYKFIQATNSVIHKTDSAELGQTTIIDLDKVKRLRVVNEPEIDLIAVGVDCWDEATSILREEGLNAAQDLYAFLSEKLHEVILEPESDKVEPTVYLLFGGQAGQRKGGWGDFLGYATSVDSLVASHITYNADWWQIVDSNTKEVVANS